MGRYAHKTYIIVGVMAICRRTMNQMEYQYRCSNCEWVVETVAFREARECPECDVGMLVNKTIQE